jgi:hypothetical protein
LLVHMRRSINHMVVNSNLKWANAIPLRLLAGPSRSVNHRFVRSPARTRISGREPVVGEQGTDVSCTL